MASIALFIRVIGTEAIRLSIYLLVAKEYNQL